MIDAHDIPDGAAWLDANQVAIKIGSDLRGVRKLTAMGVLESFLILKNERWLSSDVEAAIANARAAQFKTTPK